jgi:hypothetical protein
VRTASIIRAMSVNYVRFQVLTAASMMFRIVFWDILQCKMIVDRRFRGAYCLHRQASNGDVHLPCSLPGHRYIGCSSTARHGSTMVGSCSAVSRYCCFTTFISCDFVCDVTFTTTAFIDEISFQFYKTDILQVSQGECGGRDMWHAGGEKEYKFW